MFCDSTDLKIGDVSVKVRRLTLREIRESRVGFRSGEDCLDEHYDKLIKSHVTLADGAPLDPSDLSIPQMQKIVAEMVGIPEGSGISDFIGLLC